MSAKIDTEMYDLFGIIVSNLWKGINCVSHRRAVYSVKLSLNCMKEVVLSYVKVYCEFRGQNDYTLMFALSNMCKEQRGFLAK